MMRYVMVMEANGSSSGVYVRQLFPMASNFIYVQSLAYMGLLFHLTIANT
jgi:hypothetical protein